MNENLAHVCFAFLIIEILLNVSDSYHENPHEFQYHKILLTVHLSRNRITRISIYMISFPFSCFHSSAFHVFPRIQTDNNV